MFKSKAVSCAIYTYIALPFIIFAAGFLKWYFAVPFTLATVLSVFLAAKNSDNAHWGIKIDRYDKFKMLVGFIVIVILVLSSGIGNILWQNPDHATRNTLFNALVTYPWPPTDIPKADTLALVYYIGFWLPSALFGKLTSLWGGYVFQIIWASLGIFILWYLLCLIHKKVVIYPLVLFFLFSGLDQLGLSLMEHFSDSLSVMQQGMWAYPEGSAMSSHLEWWAGKYQYSSHITQLYWVFNQCLPVWLATLLLLLEKNNKNLVFIMGLTLLSSTLPFIGLIPVFVWCAVTQKNSPTVLERKLTANAKGDFLSLFTFQNVIGGGISGIVSFLYLKGNIASSGAASSAATSSAPQFSLPVFLLVLIAFGAVWAFFTSFSPFKIKSLLFLSPALPLAYLSAKVSLSSFGLYLLFVTLEVLVIAVLAFVLHRHSSLLFLTVVSLLLIPFFKVGRSIDFCMRASIPLLVILSLFLTDAFATYFSQKRYKMFAVTLAVIAIGALTPIHEITRTAEASIVQIQEDYVVENPSISYEKLFKGKNFTGKTEDNFFFKFLARQ